ncbi:MAG: lipoyl(octanoyl) transferase LipB [Dysgonamonadaceae bacterium]|jgi:lipoyl(octanoyl) transferase|nr:lipoyl(octanoyl) transferase LipB [Dysgonamonadaceae bacterium]
MFQTEDWQLIAYPEAYEKQKVLFEHAIRQKLAGVAADNVLIFCEHPPVITIGKSGKDKNLLVDSDMLASQGVEVFRVDRGGDVTFHGPGQLVGYPVFDLESLHLGLKDYIHLLEEAVIRLLNTYGIQSSRLKGATGVWLDTDAPPATRKICAIGVRSSHYVTMHGFALNVNTQLDYFRLINPCGFVDKGVTSLEAELKTATDMAEVKRRLLQIFFNLFGG